MRLKLEATKYKGSFPDRPLSVTFDENGGGIGRLPAPENRFHLPDPDKYISRKHAHIKYLDGAFHLTDMSTAGTFCMNKNRSIHHDTIRLDDGDQLRIGEYELRVSLTDTAESDNLSPPNFDRRNEEPFFDSNTPDWDAEESTGGDGFSWPEQAPLNGPVESESFTPPSVEPHPSRKNDIPPDFDINELLMEKEGPHPTPQNDSLKFSEHSGALPKKWRWPAARETLPAEKKQTGHQPLSSSQEPVPTHPATPSRRAANTGSRLSKALGKAAPTPAGSPPETAAGLLDIFLEAAGLNASDIDLAPPPEETMRTLGALFRELVSGLMTILQARSELKSQFRVSMTVIRPSENNPLKFSAHGEDAIKQLLRGDDAAFLDPIAAVKESFEDIGNHQMALAAGIQSSLMTLLKRFDPEHFEKRFDRGLAIGRQAKSWNAYREAYDGIVREIMEEIFGTAFSRAYEQQIQKLRSARKKE